MVEEVIRFLSGDDLKYVISQAALATMASTSNLQQFPDWLTFPVRADPG